MDICDLNFSTVLNNLQHPTTVFHCDPECEFLRTLRVELGIESTRPKREVDEAMICYGKVYTDTNVIRCPSVYDEDGSAWFDITIIPLKAELTQVIITKTDEQPAFITLRDRFDPYDVFYKYVERIGNLKHRASFEQQFFNNMNKENCDIEEDVFASHVREDIVKKICE